MTTQAGPLTTISPERRRGLEMLLGRRRGDDVLAYRLATRLEQASNRAKGHAA